MAQDISIFLPMRAGSQRVPGKNTIPFHPDGRSLFQWKLAQLAKVADEVREVIVSSDDGVIRAQFDEMSLPANFTFSLRPAHLAASTTRLGDLIEHVPQVTSGEWILWTHVTSPFLDERHLRQAFDRLQTDVIDGTHDSLMSVTPLREYIWSASQRRIVNVDASVNRWPSTQDLEVYYEVNSGFFIAARDLYLRSGDRIGENPALFECDKITAVDVDWPADFALAKALLPLYDAGREQE